ncbi:MAG: hypothetical protein HYY93_01440 [Planctomycetes bacterium]|nr:hypothetical protein [Planctomycetota bacterium]
MAGRNRATGWVAAVLALFGGAGLASAQDVHYHPAPFFYGDKDWSIGLEVGGYYAAGNLEAAIEGTPAASATNVDFESVTGTDSSDIGFNVGGYVAWGDHMVNLEYFGVGYDGGKTLTQAVVFGDNTYVIGTAVNASTDLSVIDALYTYKFYNMDPRYYFGAQIGVSYISVEGTISGGGVSDSDSASAPVPVLGLRAEGYVWDRYVSLSGEIHGMSIGSAGTTFEATLKVNGHITENIGAYLGYKYFSISVDEGNVDADFSTSGLIFGAELRF